MFKVPSDPHHPTYDHATTVGFWQWLTSSGQDRREWRRRRDAATHTTDTARTLGAVEHHAQVRLDQAHQAKANLRAEKAQRKADRIDAKRARRHAKQVRKIR